MSHDRGCSCGRERWDYDDCPDRNCHKKERAVAITRDIAQEATNRDLTGSQDTSGPADFINDRSFDANEKQVGGSHYRKQKFQHWDFVLATGIGYLEGCATKYLSRWQDKNGLEDLEKPVHYIEKMIEAHKNSAYANPAYGPIMLKNVSDYPEIKKKLLHIATTFCTDNEILPIDARTIKLITSWQTLDELLEAHELSSGLVAIVKKQTAGVLIRR